MKSKLDKISLWLCGLLLSSTCWAIQVPFYVSAPVISGLSLLTVFSSPVTDDSKIALKLRQIALLTELVETQEQMAELYEENNTLILSSIDRSPHFAKFAILGSEDDNQKSNLSLQQENYSGSSTRAKFYNLGQWLYQNSSFTDGAYSFESVLKDVAKDTLAIFSKEKKLFDAGIVPSQLAMDLFERNNEKVQELEKLLNQFSSHKAQLESIYLRFVEYMTELGYKIPYDYNRTQFGQDLMYIAMYRDLWKLNKKFDAFPKHIGMKQIGEAWVVFAPNVAESYELIDLWWYYKNDKLKFQYHSGRTE